MQRRNSARSQGLSRKKSTSSTKSVHLVHINPDTAEHDAQSAAIQAFARARERSLHGTAQWPPPRLTERPMPRRHRSAFAASQTGNKLRRQQSVRFVQPRPPESGPGDAGLEHTPSRKPNARIRENRKASQTQPQHNASAAGIVFAAKGTAGDYINALITGEDYYTPEDDIASMPSSYRRLRKSKSMYAGPIINKVTCLNSDKSEPERGLQSTKVCQQNPDVPDIGNKIDARGRRLAAPRSMSFLRTRGETSSTFTSKTPKNKLLDSIAPGSDHLHIKKSKSSGFLRPKPGRQDKLFRKTLRDTSTGTNSLGAKALSDGSLRLKARKVSQNFKHKLKTFFSMSKENDEIGKLPPQQVKSGRTHAIGTNNPIYCLDDSYLTAEDTESTIVSRVTSGIPALHAVPSELQLHSRRGSLESLCSERKVSDEKSRVTSWSDSDAKTYSTVTSSQGEWDKHQLSVIDEHGSRINFHNHKQPASHPLCSATIENAEHPVSDTLAPTKNVNGQRVYSALMKRLDEYNPKTKVVQDTRQKSVEDFMVQGEVPVRDSSKGFTAAGKTKLAMKDFPANDRTETDLIGATSTATIRHGTKPDVVSHDTENDAVDSAGAKEMITSLPSRTLPPGGNRGIDSQDAAISLPRSLTSPELERPAPSGRTLSERSSVFFGSPSCNLFRTQSPYRRAIRDSMKAAAEDIPAKSPEFNPWTKSLKSIRFRCPSTCESEDDGKITYEESIYSSDGAEISYESSCRAKLNEKLPSPPENHGAATIFLGPAKYATPTSKPARRVASSASSVEWKTWLSANLSALDQTCPLPEQYNTGEEEADTPRLPWMSGHVRENAEIEGEQDSAKFRSRCQGLTGSSPNIDYGTASVSPMSMQHSLRSALSLANLGLSKDNISISREQDGKSGVNSAQPKPLFHARSLDALGIQDQNIATSKIRLARKQSNSKLHVLPLSTPMTGIGAQRQIVAKLSRAGDLKAYHSDAAGNMKSENISPRAAGEYDSHVLRAPSLHNGEGSPKRLSMASKHMVELFLDSRRRHIAGTDDTDAFL